jgi:1-acyl-sn-glycerol-3-phosphate acyltransferase
VLLDGARRWSDEREHVRAQAIVAVDGAGRGAPPADWAPPSVSPATLEAACNAFAMLARYHRLEVRGLERIPEGPALLVGNHNGGVNPVDALFLVEYYRQRGYQQPVYVLAHDVLFRIPALKRAIESVGGVPAHPAHGRRLLEAGHKLLVFPGGDVENLRPFSERKSVVLAGRKGFVRLAIAAGVPIVPVIGAGSHETLMVLTQGRRLAARIPLAKRLRVNSCPVILAPPWGILAGPACALPYLPLPAKVTVQIGHPFSTDPLPSDGDLEGASARLYERTRRIMQGMLDDLYAERRLPVFG